MPLEVLEDSWVNIRGLLGTESNKARMIWEKETRIGYFINIMKLCKRSCCQRVILPSAMKNSARFLPFLVTYYPSYQKGKTVLGTIKTSREVVLEKLHYFFYLRKAYLYQIYI